MTMAIVFAIVCCVWLLSDCHATEPLPRMFTDATFAQHCLRVAIQTSDPRNCLRGAAFRISIPAVMHHPLLSLVLSHFLRIPLTESGVFISSSSSSDCAWHGSLE